jgi:hypothetical protein
MHLEAIYRIEAPDVTQFQIDQEQLEWVMGTSLRNADEWVLARSSEDGLDLAVFIAEAHLNALEKAGSLADAAVRDFPAFCAATEGVSHFLMLVERARREEPVTMLELEAQAEVDKFVCASLHHPNLSNEWWGRLFRDAILAEDLGPEERERYQEAGRLAAGFCVTLDQAPHVDALLQQLRRFWRDSGAQRLERMRRLAA